MNRILNFKLNSDLENFFDNEPLYYPNISYIKDITKLCITLSPKYGNEYFVTYTNLSITADDVKYSNTTTTIYYTATYNIVDENNNIIKRGLKENGTAISEPFDMNLSTTETVQREISFAYGGLTATTVITQDLRDYMELQPFTIEVLDGSQMVYYAETTRQGSMYYSIDEGLNWNLATSGENVPLSENGKYLWKGTFSPDDTINDGIGAFLAMDFNVYGNIMSLIYGDEFEDKFSLEGYKGCFSSLFRKTAPVLRPIYAHDASNLKLPATTLSDDCYSSMFYSSPTLLSAPELPATTLAKNCYALMFSSCDLLTNVPSILPATTLADNCYNAMFQYCTSLTTAPELPATTLADNCYRSMFYGCESLTTAPELPATTLAEYCYGSMFYYCTSLTTAPELPATTLVKECYYSMFQACNKLNYIKMLATDISATNCMKYWVSGVAPTGTFVKNAYATWDIIGDNGVPRGWQIIYNDDYIVDNELPPLYFEALEDDFTLSFNIENIGILRYSVDGKTWNTLESDTNTTPINKGEKIYLRGNLVPGSYPGIGRFTINKQCNVAGNVMSLLFANDFVGKTDLNGYDFVFYCLFGECTNIQSAKNLILPATTLTDGCYDGMFWECTSLTTAPSKLPATTLTTQCYYSMFNGCTSLTSVPELHATELATHCYAGMFYECTKLQVVTKSEFIAFNNTYSGFNGTLKDCYMPKKQNVIINLSNTDEVIFNYFNGIYSALREETILTDILSQEEISTLAPEYNLVVTVYDNYPDPHIVNTTNVCEHITWEAGQSLEEFAEKFNFDYNHTSISILYTSRKGGDYYYYD